MSLSASISVGPMPMSTTPPKHDAVVVNVSNEDSECAIAVFEPAADHHLARLEVLHLDPFTCPPARHVLRTEPLSDQTLKPLLSRRGKERRTVAYRVRGRAPRVAVHVQFTVMMRSPTTHEVAGVFTLHAVEARKRAARLQDVADGADGTHSFVEGVYVGGPPRKDQL